MALHRPPGRPDSDSPQHSTGGRRIPRESEDRPCDRHHRLRQMTSRSRQYGDGSPARADEVFLH